MKNRVSGMSEFLQAPVVVEKMHDSGDGADEVPDPYPGLNSYSTLPLFYLNLISKKQKNTCGDFQ